MGRRKKVVLVVVVIVLISKLPQDTRETRLVENAVEVQIGLSIKVFS